METTSDSQDVKKPYRVPEDTWMKMRDEYLRSNQTVQQVAIKFGIPYPTVRDRSIRDEWVSAKRSGKGLVEKAVTYATTAATVNAMEEAVKKVAMESTLTAQALVRKTLKDSDVWLDRISRVSGKETNENPDAIRKLTGAWKDVISVARLTHGLDQAGTTVNVAIFGKPVAVESEAIETVVQVSHPQESNPPTDSTADS